MTTPSSSFLPSEDRLKLMQQGVEQLEAWLHDLMRMGVLQFDFSSIHEISARMVDAKLGGIARRLRRLEFLDKSSVSWLPTLAGVLGDMYLFVSTFKKLDQLPKAMLSTVLSVGGFNFQKSQLSTLKGHMDHWVVAGISYDQEENLRSRYTWLMGSQSKRTALVLDFAFGRTNFDMKFDFARAYQGKIVYYPSSFPLRAILLDPISLKLQQDFPAAFNSISKFLDLFALAISKNPWLDEWPASLKEVQLLKTKDSFLIQDEQGAQMRVSNDPEVLWPLYSSLGLLPFSLFGIWNGTEINMISYEDGLRLALLTE